MVTLRRRLTHVVVVCVGSFAWAACGTPDDGAWQPGETPQASGTVSGVAKLPRNPKEVTTEVDPVPGGGGVRFACELPSGPGYPYLLEPGADVPFRGSSNGTTFCLGESADAGQEFCLWVTRLEARQRAIAECHKTVVRALNEAGLDAVSGSAERWAEVKRGYVPQAWAVPAEEIGLDLGFYSGAVALMMNGGSSLQAPSTPFCFQKNVGAEVGEAKAELLRRLYDLWRDHETKEKATLVALQRGVDVPAQDGVAGVKMSVRFVEVGPSELPVKRSCSFFIPPLLY
ncbi:MAG: hypothetical protein IT371_13435 [Deltaproteobacteria bacterium]|nr:hypothetical protein [Deltaproteobacteria bacterium]